MTKLNIFSENITDIEIDEKKAINLAKKILKFYLEDAKIFGLSCLAGQKFNTLSFDILYTDNKKTHEINREYRQKDYPADIITFAIFADGEEKFVFDGEINLGEIIISLEKVLELANSKQQTANSELSLREANEISDAAIQKENPSTLQPFSPSAENELYFLISHGIMHLLGFEHETNEDYNFIIEAQTSALKKVRGE